MEEMVVQCMDMMNEVGGMMGSGMMDGGMMGSSTVQSVMTMPFWILAWLLVLSVIAAVVLTVWAARRGAVSTPHGAETPLPILKRRYAAGEIDAEQFQKVKVQLGES